MTRTTNHELIAGTIIENPKLRGRGPIAKRNHDRAATAAFKARMAKREAAES